ncbi:MAG: hypothetical protein ACREVJ_02410, partial [Gammaproteobacteria bacterium]
MKNRRHHRCRLRSPPRGRRYRPHRPRQRGPKRRRQDGYVVGTLLIGADPTAFIDNERLRYQGQLERYAALMGGL